MATTRYTDGLIRSGSFIYDRARAVRGRVTHAYGMCPFGEHTLASSWAPRDYGPNPMRFVNSPWVAYVNTFGDSSFAPLENVERIEPFADFRPPWAEEYFTDMVNLNLQLDDWTDRLHNYEYGNGYGFPAEVR